VASTILHVRNPDSVVTEVGNFVDFAVSAHFISGEATGPAYNWNFGDIVGAIQGEDERYPVTEPYYRYSLSGYCPNLKWKQKKKGAIDAIKDFKKRELSGAKPESGRRRRRQPGLCMTYSNQFNLPFGEVLAGGLCPNGTEPGAKPTGGPGCVYTYDPPKGHAVVNLDELVGITKEDCGGRLCRNWKDFRRHCSNKHYHRKFNYKSRRRYSTLLRSKLCIEYDIHKDCAKDCNSAACHKVPPNKRELGLPFWRGRCSAHMNAQRSERLAQAFGVTKAGKAHQLLQEISEDTCLSNEKMCHPDPNSGGMYCSRAWAGICQPCYIPNTGQPYTEAKTTPICPWSVLMTKDYSKKPAMQPNCTSKLPRDLCCLYSDTCDTSLTSDPLPVTEDGFAFAASRQDTAKMADFLQRAAHQAYAANVTNLVKLRGFAYWQWGLSPIVGKTFPEVMRSLRHYLL